MLGGRASFSHREVPGAQHASDETHVQESADTESAMMKILALAALAEAGFGVTLLAYPPIVVRLLFDTDIAGVGVIMSRLAGIALIGLGVSCWPGNSPFQPLR